MNSSIFRRKSMDKISSPEQMNDYIRVANPSVWMILAAIIVLLVGVCVWGIYGQLDTKLQTGGICEDGKLVCYIGEADFEKVQSGMSVTVGENEYTVSSVASEPTRLDESTGSYLIHLAGLAEGDWAYAVVVDAPDLQNGTYSVSIILERVRPLDFVLG